MEKLKLEHLAPYFPYGVHLMNEYGNWHNTTLNKSISIYRMLEMKPILRPLSTIGLKWFHENIDEDIEDFIINCEPENNHFPVEVCDKVLGWSALSYEEYQLIFKHHFDVFGLIDKGLAIDINTTK